MNQKKTIIVVFLLAMLAGGAWWFFHDDPEAEVRKAHEEFAELLSKPEGEASGVMMFIAQVLKTKFADTCEVTGDAERFGGSYTPEDLTGIIMQVRGMFVSLDLSFQDLMIEFPTDDEAIVSFNAQMIAQGRTEEAFETREVVSRMRKIDGDWRFTHFRLEGGYLDHRPE